ncbi:hypothetical protein C0J52_02270 [Blattella germanica]|nr:hypothetical protein C0J52_02270 [Blattella germanica]
MTLIEGVGDEVTQFFVLISVILVGVIAWWSTSIADQPLIRTVLILERRRHRVATEPPPTPPTASTSLENSIDTGQLEAPSQTSDNRQELDAGAACRICDKESANISSPTATSSSSTVNSDWEVPETSNGAADEGGASREETIRREEDNENRADPESNLLRSRRLAFFQSRQVTLLDSPASDGPILTTSSSTESEGSELDASESRTATDNATCNTSESRDDAPSAGSIRIRLKYLNDDQKLVEGKLQEQLGDFKRRHFSLEMSADKLVRLIFNGQVLQSDNETLQGYGLFDNCVVHCLVHQQRSGSANQAGGADNQSGRDSANNGVDATPHRDWDLGNVLFASLSLLLVIAWYCRYQYAQLFNGTTTVALVGLTGILTVSLVGVYLPDQDGIRQ